MQFRVQSHCELKRLDSAAYAGLSAADVFVLFHRDVIAVFGTGRFEILSYRGLVFAVNQNS